ncbi:DUF3520 domain-containing protein [Persicimonas caeni]|uniref:DUF3520 domain-containing protein n=1 Tax=Persicimonas caeni TaxID=2292766 RepID=A0A4Y6PQ57_PERCE|nr:von Willebrand factor type A domain-containing protein [Persicimonas caeni]QDG50466.1 DUF3520 domain-containing protein [Persicimonas caeni]QED31687.1 DUF3520 domain-containing protein [Persicimonas caeni]
MRPTLFKYLLIACALSFAACEAEEPKTMDVPDKAEEPDRFVQMMAQPDEAQAEEAEEAKEGEEAAVPTPEADEAQAQPAVGPASTKAGEDMAGVEKVFEKKDSNLWNGKSDAKVGSDAITALGSLDGEGGSARGLGGLGISGAGRGGGGIASKGVVGSGEGYGRIQGLGSVSTGGGKGYGSASVGRKVKARKVYPNLAPAPEPNTAQRNTESYANHGVNQMTDTAKDAKSTFAIDVDTGAYTIARRKLQNGQVPPEASVRVEEFVNYFRYSYPDPDSGAFAVHMEAAPSPFLAEDEGKTRKILRVGVQGKRVTKTTRKPVHLTFLVDVSGSMSSPDKLGLAQKSLEILTNNLRQGDSVAIATYAGRVAKILDPTGLENKGRILTAIESLKSGGSTAMNSGLEIAYKLALANFQKDHVNRVIVLSDGDANVGPSSHQAILKRIEHFVDEGVTLSTIGFGMGNYKDTLMEQLANKGNGNYYYIDTAKEARKVFGEQLDGTLQVIAKDVKIQVEFDKEAVKSYRLIGYENRDIADKDFRNDKVDAGEIGAGHTVTALYEMVLTDKAKDAKKLATVRIRAKKPDGAKASEQAFLLTHGDLKDSIRKASKDFQFAAAVAGFAELLRGSKYANALNYDLIHEIAKSGTSAGQQDRQEFLKLVEKAKSLQKG